MNCEKFLDRIQLALDGDLELELSIEESEHLWQCDACAEAWQELQEIEDLSRYAGRDIQVEAPADLHVNIMNVLRQEAKSLETEKRGRRRRISPLIPLSAAAVVLLAFGLGIYFDWQSQQQLVISAPRIRINAPIAATLLNPQQQVGAYLQSLNKKASMLNVLPEESETETKQQHEL